MEGGRDRRRDKLRHGAPDGNRATTHSGDPSLHACHPERSEGASVRAAPFLRCAQDHRLQQALAVLRVLRVLRVSRRCSSRSAPSACPREEPRVPAAGHPGRRIRPERPLLLARAAAPAERLAARALLRRVGARLPTRAALRAVAARRLALRGAIGRRALPAVLATLLVVPPEVCPSDGRRDRRDVPRARRHHARRERVEHRPPSSAGPPAIRAGRWTRTAAATGDAKHIQSLPYFGGVLTGTTDRRRRPCP